MRISQVLLPTLALHLLIGVAPAVTFNLAGDWLADEEGVQGIPNGSLIMLIASTEDAEFSPPGEHGLIDPESDDVILGSFSASDDNGRANRGSYAATVQANFGDSAQGLEHFDGGDPLLIRWFPTLKSIEFDTSSDSVIPYGEFRSDEVLLGSNATWITPGSNSATINLSIVADAVGNRYNPNGPLPKVQLASNKILERAIVEAVQVHLTVSALANGSINLSWPLLDGANPAGRLQQSVDLLNWTDVPVKVDLSERGRASATTEPEGGVRFYRIASGGSE